MHNWVGSFAKLAHNLTIAARQVTAASTNPLQLHEGFNELQHLISGRIVAIAFDQPRTDYSEFKAILEHAAKNHGISKALENALAMTTEEPQLQN